MRVPARGLLLSLAGAFAACQVPAPARPLTIPGECRNGATVPLTQDLLNYQPASRLATLPVYAALPFSLTRMQPPSDPSGQLLRPGVVETVSIDCLRRGTIVRARSYGRPNDVLTISFGDGVPLLRFENEPPFGSKVFGDRYWLRPFYGDGARPEADGASVYDDAPLEGDLPDVFQAPVTVKGDSFLLIDPPASDRSLWRQKILK